MGNTTHLTCRNCNETHQSSFQFCPSCGQKNTDGKITFGEMWSVFKDAVFGIESRTWRTFRALFVPGKLTLEYFAGRHRRYVHPLRLLLVTSLLIILALSFQDFQSATNHGYIIKDRILENYERQRANRILENILDSTNQIYPTPQTHQITDTILTIFHDSLRSLLHRHGDRYGDSIDIARYTDMGFNDRDLISKYHFLNIEEDSLVKIYKKEEGWFKQLLFKQRVKYIKDEAKLSAAFLGYITWAILLMMPCLALLLYFLYFRHAYYYIEHLIFAFHMHAFSFLIGAILIAGINKFPGWVFALALGIIGVYLYISLWRVYGQSKRKTLWKYLILNILYVVLFQLFLLLTFLTTFLLF